MSELLKVGLVSVSDRASSGVYQDKGIPALQEWLSAAIVNPLEIKTSVWRSEDPDLTAERRRAPRRGADA